MGIEITNEELLELQCNKIEKEIIKNIYNIIDKNTEEYLKYKKMFTNCFDIKVTNKENIFYIKNVYIASNIHDKFSKFEYEIKDEDFNDNFMNLTLKMLDYILKDFTVFIYKIEIDSKEKAVNSAIFNRKFEKIVCFCEISNIIISNILFDYTYDNIQKINIYNANDNKLVCSINF